MKAARFGKFGLVSAIATMLAACGGGGGGGTTTVATPTVTCTAPQVLANGACVSPTPIKAFTTSYENAKGYGLSRINFPASLNTFVADQPLAWGAGDFFQRGAVDIFTAKQNYSLPTSYATVNGVAQYQSDFQFWERDPGTGALTLKLTYKGCLHPRKGVVADFNNDGFPDVFVACHGYDGDADPSTTKPDLAGEKSKLLLNDGKGGFTLTDVGETTSYFHGASAADINGDGWIDIAVADISVIPNIYFLINNKDGTFTSDTTRVTNLVGGPYNSLELLDVNSDGKVDLLVGGHENDGAQTSILFGNGATFGAVKTIIPAIAGRGVVLDFTLINTTLFVNRTADGTGGLGFYQARSMQKFDVVSANSTLPYDVPNGQWMAWWLPTANGSLVPFNNSLPGIVVQ